MVVSCVTLRCARCYQLTKPCDESRSTKLVANATTTGPASGPRLGARDLLINDRSWVENLDHSTTLKGDPSTSVPRISRTRTRGSEKKAHRIRRCRAQGRHGGTYRDHAVVATGAAARPGHRPRSCDTAARRGRPYGWMDMGGWSRDSSCASARAHTQPPRGARRQQRPCHPQRSDGQWWWWCPCDGSAQRSVG